MKIEEIKNLMKSGDVAGAAEAAEELLKGDPDNVRALILFGTCRQLQGDETTFRDTYSVVKERLDANPGVLDAEANAAWKRFEELYTKLNQPGAHRHRPGMVPRKPVLMEYVVLAVLVASAVVAVYIYWGAEIEAVVAAIKGEPPAVEPLRDDHSAFLCCAADIDYSKFEQTDGGSKEPME